MPHSSYEEQTQRYSTFGNKLLQHLDVLSKIQLNGQWRPITVQLSVTAACSSNCVFCSVKYRQKGLSLPLDLIKKGLKDFRDLGAKSVEITGGGEPLLYQNIKELIDYSYKLGFDIGIISNTNDIRKFISKAQAKKLTWYRVSLHKLDEGLKPSDYKFEVIPKGKLGFSYIINKKTTRGTIKQIVELIRKRPDVKFVRIAGDCLDKNNLLTIKDKWVPIIEEVNELGKFFIKEINGNYLPYPKFCGVGAIRPYCVENGNIYICTSHVLKFRRYDQRYIIGHLSDVKGMYRKINEHYCRTGRPYDIDISKCFHCFYYNNNKLLDTIVTKLPDKNFP